MANPTNFPGDITANGQISGTSLYSSGAFLSDAMVNANAKIAATKLQIQHQKTYNQESATAAVSEARVVHVVFGLTGTLIAFKAGCVVANVGAATVTFDCLKNGVTVLTAVITLDNGTAAYILKSGTFSGTSVVAGDVLEVKTVATAGGGTLAKGAFAEITLREDAA